MFCSCLHGGVKVAPIKICGQTFSEWMHHFYLAVTWPGTNRRGRINCIRFKQQATLLAHKPLPYQGFRGPREGQARD